MGVWYNRGMKEGIKELWDRLGMHIENEDENWFADMAVMGEKSPVFVWMLYVYDLHRRLEKLEGE